MSDIGYFQNRAILTTKNNIVEKINDYMLDMVLDEEKVYLSYDSPIHHNLNDDCNALFNYLIILLDDMVYVYILYGF